MNFAHRKRSPKIVAVNRFYRPDHSATSQHLADLVERLVEDGWEATVLTSRLRYDGGARPLKRERIAGVEVRRIPSTGFGQTNLVGRALDYASFDIALACSLLWRGRRGDVLLVTTDPPMVSVIAAAAAAIRGMKLVNWCHDLFPETAGALGMTWANGWIGGILRSLRNWSLKRASINAAIDELMASRLEREGISRRQIRVLPNWCDGAIRPIDDSANPLREAWGIADKFVIGYAGNLGRAHMADAIADLVVRTRHIEGLAWLFIGGGVGQAQVRNAVGEADNVLFMPYQPIEALSQALSAPDVHLISLDPACEGLVVPSKVYGVRAVGRPVIFLGDRSGAVGKAVQRYGAGSVLDPDLPDTWVDEIEKLKARIQSGDAVAAAWRTDWSSEAALAGWTSTLTSLQTTEDAIAVGSTAPQTGT